MPSEPPNDLLPAPAETPALAETPEPALAETPPPPAEPVSPVKEWAVAVALMIVFAIICAQFIGFLRSNQYGP
jgi:hypothetical protein